MTISANYVNEYTFTTHGTNNFTEEFHSGRRVRSYCGGDGYKYGTVSGSFYLESTTVVLYPDINNELTNNLESVEYGIVGTLNGSMPNHSHLNDESQGGLLFEASIVDLDKYTTGEIDNMLTTLSGSIHDPVSLSIELLTNLLDISTQQLTLDTQAPNTVFAGPATGVVNGYPAFRALVASDIPALSYVDTETDPVFTAWDRSTGISITESQISDLGSYLTSLTGLDTDDLAEGSTNKYFPGFTSLLTDYSFTDNSSNWNTAYGWGNHASGGYVKADGTVNFANKVSYNNDKTFTSDTELVSKKYVDDSIISVGGYTDKAAQDAVGAIIDSNNLIYNSATPLLSVKHQMSLTSDASGLKLSGDSVSPGNNKVYGTDASGTKGWQNAGSDSMTYPGAGIALSTGSAWGSSITNNSANWNTAYSWGNHASAGYLNSASTGVTANSWTINSGKADINVSLTFGRTTGGDAVITYSGNGFHINKPVGIGGIYPNYDLEIYSATIARIGLGKLQSARELVIEKNTESPFGSSIYFSHHETISAGYLRIMASQDTEVARFVGADQSTLLNGQLTIDLGAKAAQTILLKRDGITNPFSAMVDTRVWGNIMPYSYGLGGINVYGYSSGDSGGVVLTGLIGTNSPTSATPAVLLRGGKFNGVNDARAVAATERVFQIDNWGTTIAHINGFGSLVLGGNLVVNGTKADVTSTLTFGRTTGGDATLSWNGSILETNKPIKVNGNTYGDPSTSPNKIILWQSADNNYYGFGISANTLDYFSQSVHRWYTQYNGTPGVVAMTLNSPGNLSLLGNLTINSTKADVTSTLTFGRTTGGDGVISYNGGNIVFNKGIQLTTSTSSSIFVPISNSNGTIALIVAARTGALNTDAYFGFYDADSQWAYQIQTDTHHAWFINNATKMQLTSERLIVNAGEMIVSGIKSVYISGSSFGVKKQANAGGWAFGYGASKESDNTIIAEWGFYGNNDVLNYGYFGPTYTSNYLRVAPTYTQVYGNFYVENNTVSINSSKADVVSSLIFGRTTGGDVVISWNGAKLGISQPIQVPLLGVGIDPNAIIQLYNRNDSLIFDGTSNRYGFYNVTTRTGGNSNGTGIFYGLRNFHTYNQSGGYQGSIYGILNDFILSDGTIGTSSGASKLLVLNETICDINGGTVNGAIYGIASTIRIKSTGTVTGNTYGLFSAIQGANYTDGNSYLVYLVESSIGVNYAIYHSGSAPSYFGGNVSAESFTDRTPFYDGDAVAEIMNIKGKDGEIDHSSLPSFARKEITKRRFEDVELTNEIDAKDAYTYDTRTVEVKGVKQEEIIEGSKKLKDTVYEDEKTGKFYEKDSVGEVKIKDGKPYQSVDVGEEIEQGRDLGAMISMLTVAVQQLTNRLSDIEKWAEKFGGTSRQE